MTIREHIIVGINEAVKNGAKKSTACSVLNLPIRTLQRWENDKLGDKRSIIIKHPANKITDSERRKVLEICCSDEYKNMTPNEIVPRLAEKGQFIASEASFYRILKDKGLVKRSNPGKSSRRKKATELIATGPSQVWSWDITYLRSPVKGLFYYLYLFQDIWSRSIVGWRIHETESAEFAAAAMEDICSELGIKTVKLHADNGSPMKGATMLATLQRLGVIPSFSRPGVSNDNPYSESLFKTLKYHAGYPDYFESIDHARAWVKNFVDWYNNFHLHSGIKFVTPMQRHLGLDKAILETRKITYQKAKQKNPMRWSGDTRNWDWQETVILNPETKKDLLVDIAC
ncbi:MAG: IS3 family transposase [Spirochaetia bacterium]|nr:IS3 family transposase [Spirochaetia bacterium]